MVPIFQSRVPLRRHHQIRADTVRAHPEQEGAVSGNAAVFKDRCSRWLFAVEAGMHGQRKSQIADLDRIGRAVRQVNSPAEHTVPGLEANGHRQRYAAIVLRLIHTRGVCGRRGLRRVKFLPGAVRAPPCNFDMIEFLTSCNVVCWEGISGEAETRKCRSVELELERKSGISCLCQGCLGTVMSQDKRRKGSAGRKSGSPQQELTTVRSHRLPRSTYRIQVGIQSYPRARLAIHRGKTRRNQASKSEWDRTMPSQTEVQRAYSPDFL